MEKNTDTWGSILISAFYITLLWLGIINIFVANNDLPPSKGILERSSGSFQVNYGPSLSNGPYIFSTDDGRKIELNCEKYPALNNCLSDANSKLQYGSPVEIRYYDAGVKNHPYNVIMSVNHSGIDLVSYNHRLFSIINTSVARLKDGSPPRRLGFNSTLPVSFVAFGIALFTSIAVIMKAFKKALSIR